MAYANFHYLLLLLIPFRTLLIGDVNVNRYQSYSILGPLYLTLVLKYNNTDKVIDIDIPLLSQQQHPPPPNIGINPTPTLTSTTTTISI